MRSGSTGDWSMSGDMIGQTWIDTMIFAHSAGWFPIYFFATEKKYYHDNLCEHKGNIKQVFKLYNSLLGRKKEQLFPPGLNSQELADKFNEFFITKITNIRSDLLEQDTQSSDTQPENCLIPNALAKISPP